MCWKPLDDVNAFTGGIEMPHSGPYSIVAWDNTQKILDLREDWWAVDAGLIDTPDVKRVHYGQHRRSGRL